MVAEECYGADLHYFIGSKSHNMAKSRGCFLEINAHPERLDLLDIYCQLAKDKNVLVSINSDAHSSFDFANLRFGVGQARRD